MRPEEEAPLREEEDEEDDAAAAAAPLPLDDARLPPAGCVAASWEDDSDAPAPAAGRGNGSEKSEKEGLAFISERWAWGSERPQSLSPPE